MKCLRKLVLFDILPTFITFIGERDIYMYIYKTWTDKFINLLWPN